ncbi:hypothetical protein IMCC21224_11650 [Puniceibacterium sp. IMCC21224]|nr:hypothetical protein IMCC21224_11650 [Puniceibacterium sp. IMCC21224]
MMTLHTVGPGRDEPSISQFHLKAGCWIVRSGQRFDNLVPPRQESGGGRCVKQMKPEGPGSASLILRIAFRPHSLRKIRQVVDDALADLYEDSTCRRRHVCCDCRCQT